MRRAAYIEAALAVVTLDLEKMTDTQLARVVTSSTPVIEAMYTIKNGQRREREKADRRREWGKEIRQKRKQGKL